MTSSASTPAASTESKLEGRFEKGKTHYIRYVGKRKYMGEDGGDKPLGIEPHFLSVLPGDVVEVTAQKAKQLFRDFRGEWQNATEADFDKSERERRQREEEHMEQARKQHEASVERARKARIRNARSSQTLTDDDDEDED